MQNSRIRKNVAPALVPTASFDITGLELDLDA